MSESPIVGFPIGVPEITVSVVSHGHENWLPKLLGCLVSSAQQVRLHVLVTHNLKPIGDPLMPWRGRLMNVTLEEVVNQSPAGFGTNHNRAFDRCRTPWFAVVNPDILFDAPELWSALLARAGQTGADLVYPQLINPDGSRQDNERTAVTPWALLRRRLLLQAEQRVDWISAAFWLVRSDAFRALGGFDERYFLYCEDTDFCLRLRLRDGRLVRAEVSVVHQAQRATFRRWRHLVWHLASLARLWVSPVLWRYMTSGKSRPPKSF